MKSNLLITGTGAGFGPFVQILSFTWHSLIRLTGKNVDGTRNN